MKKNTTKTGIVIPAWNNESATKGLIKSLLLSSYKDTEIVIVDPNEYNEKFSLFLRTYGIVMIRPKNDSGYSGSCNVGIRYLLNKMVDYIMIVNNDVMVDKRCIETLINYSKSIKNTELIGPRVYSLKDKNLYQLFGSYVDLLRVKTVTKWVRERKKDSQEINPYEVRKLPGACMLVSSKLIRKIGYFDEGFFLYFADTDWAKRASEKGIRMKIVPGAKVYHKISGTTSKVRGKLEYYTLRDMLFFVKKHYPFPIVFYTFIISVIRSTLSSANYHRRKILNYVLLAYWHFIIGRRGKYDLYNEKA